MRRKAETAEVLDRVLALLEREAPDEGRAALRFLGQTGAAPADWIAAADPVHMETCIDHLRVNSLPPSAIPAGDVQAGFERLQSELGDESGDESVGTDGLAFRTVGELGYVESRSAALHTPQVSALAIDGREPSEFMPDGTDGAGGQRFHRLHSEVQMVLHDTAILSEHPQRGTLAVNALWIWGGGRLPAVDEARLPTLYSDDDLVTGYWRASGAASAGVPEDLADCLAADGAPPVIVSTGSGANLLVRAVDLLNAGRMRRLHVLLDGGLEIELRHSDRFRFWRRPDPELDVRRELR